MNSFFSRKCIASLLLLATLVGTALPLLSSCDGAAPATETKTVASTEETGTGETAPATKEKERPNVAKGVIPEEKNLVLQMEKIPIANSSMTEDQLRDIILQFMKLQLTFAYTPDLGDREDYGYYISAISDAYDVNINDESIDNCKVTFQEEKYYGGIFYCGQTHGSVYRWLPFYDAETGIMDFEPIINSRRINYKDKWPDGGSGIFGNSCSSAVFWAFCRVSNKLTSCWTAHWSPKYGFVKVGDFTLSENDTISGDSDQIASKNGSQKMYRAYAQVQKADGLVHSGHAIMAVEDAHVEYHPNGTIDGENSYIIFCEQKASFLTGSPEDGGVDLSYPLNDSGAVYRVQGNFPGTCTREKWNFSYLYSKGWFPFTIPELAGLDPVEDPVVEINHEGDTIKYSALRSKAITANYIISDIHLTVTDRSGKECFTGMYAVPSGGAEALWRVGLNTALYSNTLYGNKGHIGWNLSEYTNGNYTLNIDCRISTGALIRVYSGTLVE